MRSLRVLVTRPEGSGRKTAERVAALGHRPVQVPLISAIHEQAQTIAALASPHGAVAVTSAEAIRALRRSGDDLSPHLETLLFAVGRATAEAAAKAGFRRIITSEGTGEALAATVTDHRDDIAGRLLYLAGSPRSPDFERLLGESGMPFESHTVYRMVPVEGAGPRLAAVHAEAPVDAVLFHSKHTAEEYFRLLPAGAAVPACLCFSAKVAEAVPLAARGGIFVAARPEEAELLTLLAHCS